MKRLILLISAISFVFLIDNHALSADRFTISGFVRIAESGEELIGASVFAAGTKSGVSTNSYGFYSLSLPKAKYLIRFEALGYKEKSIDVDLDRNIRMDVELETQPLLMDSVVVTAEAVDENSRRVEMGALSISPTQISAVPVLFGEQDLLKTIQLLPGVQEAGEGSAGFHVRGGGTDQNLVLLDEAIVYNSSHLLGFFSVFNSDAIKDVKLINKTRTAKYGGRLSTVLDIKMKEGNSRDFQGQAGIGLIASRLALEGPIKQERGSYMLSGRRTYFDLFLKASSDESIRKTQLYFYDLNAKANYHLGGNDRVFLSGYFGRDVLGYKGEFGLDWGNTTITARWNHIFSSRLFLNSSLIYSNFNYKVGFTNGDELVDIRSAIRNVSLKEDFHYFANANNTVKFGLQSAYHTFLPGEIEATESSINEMKIKNKYALESALYLNHGWTISPAFSLDYGVRYSSFAALGPADVFAFDEDGTPTDTVSYTGRDLIKHYGGFEPRVTARYMIDDVSSVKASYARNRQYLHLLSTSTTTTPFDFWHPSTKIVKPGIADQVAAGYFRNFRENVYETSVEIYYKRLQDQIDYRNGADIYFNEYVESQLVFGKARAYGIELLIRKNQGRITGWLSYTLSKTERQFDAVNDGSWYSARQDRTHDFEVVGMYDLGKRWTFGFNWIYYTGNAVTFPSGKYIVDDHVINLYSERNGYRMPDYHRLDIAFTWQRDKSSWNFSLYNAYGRRNAYAIEFRQSETNPYQTEAVRIALFAFFPSITYTRRF